MTDERTPPVARTTLGICADDRVVIRYRSPGIDVLFVQRADGSNERDRWVRYWHPRRQ